MFEYLVGMMDAETCAPQICRDKSSFACRRVSIVTDAISVLPHAIAADADYFRDVLLNMEWIRSRDDRRVRFCIGGESGRPDYQTEYPSGHRLQNFPRRYDGTTHILIHPTGGAMCGAGDLTEPFTWEEVLSLLKRALDLKRDAARMIERG